MAASSPPPKLALHQISLYNTGRMSSEQIMAAFVARQAQLGRLMADITAEEVGSRPQHHLIVGQRGMGKTMLLARIAAELRLDEALRQRFIPLVFAEEQYAVDRLSKLWLNCLDSLADARELAEDHDAVKKIDATVAKMNQSAMRPAKDDQLFAEEVYRAFEEAARAKGQRPVLLVDNLQLVFERLDERQQHSLRELLMRSGAPVLVGASPSPPLASQDYGAAFYDQFKVHYLNPLSVDEMRELMVRLADAVDQPDVRQRVLDYPQRLQVLRQLTGGNPRTTLTLFFLYAEDFAPKVFGDLERLLDRVTPLYKARFEELTDQQQVITSAVADHWDPVTATTLAERTTLPPATLSAQIDRLEKNGTLERVGLIGESRNAYQIAERFFNIWFLMRSASRRQRRNVEFLTRFLESFYEPEDRARIARHLMSEENLSPASYEFRCALVLSLTEPVMAAEFKRHTELLAVRAKRTCEEYSPLHELIDLAALPTEVLAFDELRQKLMAQVPAESEVSSESFAQAVLGNRGVFQSGARQHLAAYPGKPSAKMVSKLLDDLKAGERADMEEYSEEAVHWFSSRLASGKLIDPSDVQDWNHTFKQADTKPLYQMLVDTLPEHVGPRLDKDVFSSIRVRLEPGENGSAQEWWNWGCDLHSKLGAYIEAAEAYRKAIAMAPKDAQPWTNLGLLLQEHLDNPEDAEAALREAVRLDPKDATVWNNLGALLMENSEQAAEAEVVLREAIAVEPSYADAWSNLGLLLHRRLHRHEEAEQAYRKALSLDPKDGMTWGWLGDLLNLTLQRPEEAERAYREAIKLGIKEAAAWNNLAVLVMKTGLNRYQEAEPILRATIELFPEYAAAWSNLGLVLKRLKRFEEAEKVFREAVTLDPNNGVIWNNLGELLLEHLPRFAEAESAYRRAVVLNPQFAQAWKNLGYLLQDHLDQPDEAATCYRKAIELDPKDPVPRNNLGNLLRNHFRRYAEAELVYREGLAIDPAFVHLWQNLGHLLHEHLQRYEEAEKAYQQATALGGSVIAWNGLGNLYCDILNRFDDAADAFDRALTLDARNEFVLQNSLFLHRDFLGEGAAARPLLQRILDLPELACPDVVHLHEALFAAYEQNWGMAREALVKAVELRKEGFSANTTEDWLRAGAVLTHLNYGQALLEFLAGQGDTVARLRPWVEALRALLKGDRRELQNIAPEVRTTAEVLYDGMELRLKRLPEKTRRRPLPPAPKAKRPRKR